DDTHLVHMVRMAVRDHLKRPGAYEALGGLDKESLRKIANVTPGVRNEESAAFAFVWLHSEGPDATLLRYVARYLKADRLTEFFDFTRTLESRPAREQMPFLRAVQQSCQERGIAPPETFRAWAEKAAVAALESGDKAMVLDAVKLCRELKLTGAFEPMLKVALDPKAAPESRSVAFDALPSLDPQRGLEALVRVTASSDEGTAIRLKSAASLGAQNTPEARTEILKLLVAVPHAIAVQIAIGMAGSREGGEALLGAIDVGKASPRLLTDKAVEGRFRTTNVKALLERREKIIKDLPPEDDRVLQLIKTRQKGFAGAKPNPAHGQEVFMKTCAGCHKIDGKGQKVGPELDAVYTRGVERLLEDILDPNRNVDQAFRATLIKTKDGRVISGLVLREEGEVVIIQEAADKETRLSKNDIEQRVLSQLSPMPTNVVEPLSEADFYDLLAFLLQPRGQK
ncbi:MAG TPA: c-type cytochrome, partial [Planctomycetota bacterium]|nr:c-type cytochrome [Planctomycetota bacterium]